MARQEKETGGVEWRITLGDGSSKSLVPETGPVSRVWMGLKSLIAGFVLKVWKFLKKAWDIGVDDPRKVIHCLKVGMALTVVSLVYFTRPLYEGVGGNAMWAIMTVVVVFENTVGATISKSLNRVSGTTLAGFLAFGVHWVASQSGHKFEPVVIGASVFLLASAATFSRFIPSVKARFDYGALIFILTFSLVAVSGYRVEELFDLAHQRLSTIIIGTSLCVLVTMLICPIWAGQELNALISRNMDKLADSLDGCVEGYFDHHGELEDSDKQPGKNLIGYKCVLNSKTTEESMTNFARWEPAHGRFNFKHPWKQYLKIGASMRSCAYSIEALNNCVDSENQAPESIKKHLSNICLKVSSNSSCVIKELAKTIKTLKKSSSIDFLVEEMSSAVQDLQNEIKSLPNLLRPAELLLPKSKETEKTTSPIYLLEVIPVVILVSLLIETSSRIQDIVKTVEELANAAEFKAEDDDKAKQNQANMNRIVPSQQDDDRQTEKALERV
ncbi:ALUMINUM ACTIVATED MALATE TRANSPORTER FAMILY PROTEIN [Salix koriyanagi]|uniref:ALUMINUM ACTIVATED MALATE TRANSPORTER FAMILY PROTEIN n=1 Tax=Salix koriyanagi TaxID=2511006 RepID=A0A9Q0PVU7_9ROSI|nr:ALUMINUM ACTIVATED MALATE TRANSPORTER FAMILY PROTEIN [Salix koriyanagi]